MNQNDQVNISPPIIQLSQNANGEISINSNFNIKEPLKSNMDGKVGKNVFSWHIELKEQERPSIKSPTGVLTPYAEQFFARGGIVDDDLPLNHTVTLSANAGRFYHSPKDILHEICSANEENIIEDDDEFDPNLGCCISPICAPASVYENDNLMSQNNNNVEKIKETSPLQNSPHHQNAQIIIDDSPYPPIDEIEDNKIEKKTIQKVIGLDILPIIQKDRRRSNAKKLSSQKPTPYIPETFKSHILPLLKNQSKHKNAQQRTDHPLRKMTNEEIKAANPRLFFNPMRLHHANNKPVQNSQLNLLTDKNMQSDYPENAYSDEELEPCCLSKLFCTKTANISQTNDVTSSISAEDQNIAIANPNYRNSTFIDTFCCRSTPPNTFTYFGPLPINVPTMHPQYYLPAQQHQQNMYAAVPPYPKNVYYYPPYGNMSPNAAVGYQNPYISSIPANPNEKFTRAGPNVMTLQMHPQQQNPYQILTNSPTAVSPNFDGTGTMMNNLNFLNPVLNNNIQKKTHPLNFKNRYRRA